jgi:ATP synthase protein I
VLFQTLLMFGVQARPIRIVLRWQIIATAALSLVAAFLWGQDGALSAALGGAVNLAAGWAYGWVLARSSKASVGEALRTMFRAEAVKVLLIVILLWLVFTNYQGIVHAAFLLSFAITVAIFAAAIAVRDTDDNKGPRATGDQ